MQKNAAHSVVFILLVCLSARAGAQKIYPLRAGNLAVHVTGEGKITDIRTGTGAVKKIGLSTEMDGCRTTDAPLAFIGKDGVLVVKKGLWNDSLQTGCHLTERFIPGRGSLRWELEIIGDGKPWSTVIHTKLVQSLSKGSRFWTSWGAPAYRASARDTLLQEALAEKGAGANKWIDPLVPTPFTDSRFFYGAPYLEYEQPRIGFCPMTDNLFCIPLCSVLDEQEHTGYTLALSPEDNLIDLSLRTGADGEIDFSRLFNRIRAGDTLRFALDLVAHGDGWQDGLAWMSGRYPGYFLPRNPAAGRFGGTGAYSNHTSAFDTEKMKKMAFSVNWQASFDFPYMGMFLPPVGPDEKWTRYGKGLVSVKEMNDYAAAMKKSGFYVFNYFNVTEFGADVKYPYTVTKSADDPNLWKDCNDFLYGRLSGAILHVPAKLNLGHIIYPKSKDGSPFFTWGDGIAMDCGDPAYRDFLLGQARRHIKEIPDAFGICIDRMDWLRMFNMQADDGISWFDGKPARSLVTSFKNLMKDLGPLMHGAGKTILVNNHTKRIDVLKEVDGVFDEFTYSGIALNLTALLCLQKPALGWTDDAATIKAEGGDLFFQRYLYMGVFPMCPFPGNDHSIQPDPVTDQWYLDYGPLLTLLRDRQWVLRSGAVTVRNGDARANLFRTPSGTVIPVVYGRKGARSVEVTVTGMGSWAGQAECLVYHPGVEKPVRLAGTRKGNKTVLTVPLVRGCAMVVMK